jgi:hypothetical protein
MDCFLLRTTRSSWQKRQDIKLDLGRQTSDVGIQASWLLRSDVRFHNPIGSELHLINFYALFT